MHEDNTAAAEEPRLRCIRTLRFVFLGLASFGQYLVVAVVQGKPELFTGPAADVVCLSHTLPTD